MVTLGARQTPRGARSNREAIEGCPPESEKSVSLFCLLPGRSLR